MRKLMADVREFGCWPLRRFKLESERLLALRVSKMSTLCRLLFTEHGIENVKRTLLCIWGRHAERNGTC